MPLIIITGHPVVDKTRYSTSLHTYLKSKGVECVLLNEEILSIAKSSGYKDSHAEKSTRGVLKSAVHHNLSSEVYVIIDSLNYIKGFRYELFCIAKTLKTPHCCVWIQCDEKISTVWSQHQREENEGDGFDDNMLIDMRRRFEMPNERNRWDRPLFIVNMTPTDTENTKENAKETSGTDTECEKSCSITKDASNNEDNGTEIIQSSFRRKKASSNETVLSSFTSRKGDSTKSTNKDTLIFNRLDAVIPEGGAVSTGKAEDSYENIYKILSDSSITISSNVSTQQANTSGADIIMEMSNHTAEIVSAINSHQLGGEQGNDAPLLLPKYKRSIGLHRYISNAELQRYRNHFNTLNTKNPPADGITAGQQFIDYIAIQLG